MMVSTMLASSASLRAAFSGSANDRSVANFIVYRRGDVRNVDEGALKAMAVEDFAAGRIMVFGFCDGNFSPRSHAAYFRAVEPRVPVADAVNYRSNMDVTVMDVPAVGTFWGIGGG